MNPQLYKSNIPPVTPEFIAAMQAAFPNKRPNADASIGQMQRLNGQLDVIEWATQFMRKYDPQSRTGRS